MKLRSIRWSITTIAVLLVIVHLFIPNVKIDEIALILLVLAGVPWFAPFLKSVELFGAKLETRDLEKRLGERKAEDSGLVEVDKEPQKQKKTYLSAFESVVGNDPNLVLAGLRF